MADMQIFAKTATGKRITLAVLLLTSVVTSDMMTCGDVKNFYQSEACCGAPAKGVSPFCYQTITEEQVLAAQDAWGDGIVIIASTYTYGGNFTQAAIDHINNLYGYGRGPVNFKPTLAAEMQFRPTFEGALSYFVAENGYAPEDSGFAIKGWTAVRFENEAIIISCSSATAMGNYYFTTPEDTEVKVEYSFGYFLDEEGEVRINLHHSALPYPAQVSEAMVLAAQQEWGDGIVTIASTYTNGGNYTQAAIDHINTLYGYEQGPVNFKPTLAAEMQFRPTFAGALSYFVATGVVPEDSGFAIKGWTAVRFENEAIITYDSTATAMGNYYFTRPDGTEAKVEYTFGYFLDAEGELRINLHHSALPYPAQVSDAMVEAAQQEWGDGIVSIASTHTNGGNYTQVAVDHINTLYGYGLGDVLFKPTLAADVQFRPTFDLALSYFVTGVVPEDTGFAIKGWTAVRFENEAIILYHSTATAMGNYFFTKPDGTEQKVEYSFGYFLDADGALRINLHHSSLPYDPNAAPAPTPAP